MKIIILGAGQVGGTLAEQLITEDNDITVIDTNAQTLQTLQEQCDLRTILGHGAHPDVLEQAGIEDADMILAVTNADETNMLACQIAYTLFQTPKKIARVRAQAFCQYEGLFSNDAIPVDVLISPEALVTHFIAHLIEYPGALEVLDFADGLVQLVAVQALAGGALVNNPIADLCHHMPGSEARVVAVFRDDKAIVLDGETVIRANDEVYFIVARTHIHDVIHLLRPYEKPHHRIMIAGAGHIGSALAMTLEDQYRVKIIEKDPDRVKYAADELNKTIVLHGDSADRMLLLNENIEDTDVFCAITNDDEDNIMSAILAKRLGAKKVMALINRTSYAELVEGGDVDVAISPQNITIGALLSHVRRGDIVQVHTLRKGVAEAIEVIAHGSRQNSPVVGKPLAMIKLPRSATIGAIIRNNKVLLAHHDMVIEAEDHVIVVLTDKRHIKNIERLFQVGFSFF